MAEYSSGPWVTRRHRSHAESTVIREADGVPIAEVDPVNGYGYHPETTANARLIAAAPELLDGCNALLGLLQLVSGRDDLTPELREVLRSNHRIAEAEAAVAKATSSSASSQAKP